MSQSMFAEKLWDEVINRAVGLIDDIQLFDRVMEILLDEGVEQSEQLYQKSEAILKPHLTLIDGGKKHEQSDIGR